jgi:hypothetical protein
VNIIQQAFDTEEHYLGVLRVDSKDVAKARVDLKYNRIDPREIRAKVTDVSWFNRPSKQPIPIEETKYLEFYNKEEDLLLKLNETNSITFSETDCQVIEYRQGTDALEFNKDKDSKDHLTSCSYFFPLTGLTINTAGTTFHDEKGLLRGFPKSNTWDALEIDWTNEIIELITLTAKAVIYDSMTKESFESDEYNYGTVIGRQTTLVLQELNGGACFSMNDARSYIKVFFDMLSLVEQYSIDWYKERYQSGKSILTIRPNKMLSGRSLLSSRSYRYKKECLLMLPKLIDAYFALDDTRKKTFDDVIYSYRIATRAKTIETKLIYYHSCLDMLKNIFGFSKPPFTPQLKNACKKANVDLEDLDFPLGVKKKAKLRFNEIRDAFLHNGFRIDDHREIMIETRKMRALTERMILSFLGINYRETKLGFPSF